MFENFTEAARRSIFFARYEAAVRSSTFIELHHVVMGIIREERKLHTLFGSDSAEKLIQVFPITKPSPPDPMPTMPIYVNMHKRAWVPNWLFRFLVRAEVKELEELRTAAWLMQVLRYKHDSQLDRDIAVSSECRRALAYAAEEAHQLGQSNIGNLHLLLGILREQTATATRLSDCGITLDSLRSIAREHV